jgi:hypothetical protein
MKLVSYEDGKKICECKCVGEGGGNGGGDHRCALLPSPGRKCTPAKDAAAGPGFSCTAQYCRSTCKEKLVHGEDGKMKCSCECLSWPEPEPDHCYVRIMCATIDRISAVAEHCWIETRDCDGQWSRYEVWQSKQRKGETTDYWVDSHVRVRTSTTPRGANIGGDVGGGPSRVKYAENYPCNDKGRSRGNPCKCLKDRLPRYPAKWAATYTLIPRLSRDGANSNTFAAYMYCRCIRETNTAQDAEGNDVTVFGWKVEGAEVAIKEWQREAGACKGGNLRHYY